MKTNYGVPQSVFCEVWNASDSPAEAAQRLKMPKHIACARACTYRRKGLDLQWFGRPKKVHIPGSKLTDNQIMDIIRGVLDNE